MLKVGGARGRYVEGRQEIRVNNAGVMDKVCGSDGRSA